MICAYLAQVFYACDENFKFVTAKLHQQVYILSRRAKISTPYVTVDSWLYSAETSWFRPSWHLLHFYSIPWFSTFHIPFVVSMRNIRLVCDIIVLIETLTGLKLHPWTSYVTNIISQHILCMIWNIIISKNVCEIRGLLGDFGAAVMVYILILWFLDMSWVQLDFAYIAKVK